MKKIKNIFILLILLPLIFSTCKDDPIVPIDDFAASHFNWKTIDIPQPLGFVGLWAMDTSKVFLLNRIDKSLYIVSSGNVTSHYVGEYYINEIKGITNNEVYLFGTQIGGDMTIIKWNGGSFEYYPTDIHSSDFNYNWLRGCAINSNEVWILSQDGISKFDGINMTNYSYQDSLSYPMDLFLSNDNKIQYITERYFDTSYIQQSLFEFADTGFARIYNYKGAINPPRTYTFLKQINGYKFGLELNDDIHRVCVYYFTGSSFINYFCFNDKITTSYWAVLSNNPVGVNLQNFVLMAQANEFIFEPPRGELNPSKIGIINWDGNKVSKEIGLVGYESPYPYTGYLLFSINKDFYLILEPISPNTGYSTMYTGSRK